MTSLSKIIVNNKTIKKILKLLLFASYDSRKRKNMKSTLRNASSKYITMLAEAPLTIYDIPKHHSFMQKQIQAQTKNGTNCNTEVF